MFFLDASHVCFYLPNVCILGLKKVEMSELDFIIDKSIVLHTQLIMMEYNILK